MKTIETFEPIKELIDHAAKTGWSILTITESITDSTESVDAIDTLTANVQDVRVAHISIPHQDYWYVYSITFVRNSLGIPLPLDLTSKILTSLASLTMDESATVSEAGHA